MSYFIEQEIQVIGTFTDQNGEPVDATVTAELRDPLGNRAPLAVERQDEGVYWFTFVPARSGTYWYQWQADGALTTAYEGTIEVSPTKFPGSL